MTRIYPLAAALALATALPAEALAQGRVKASQRGTVSQEIASTRVTIAYDRPVARGRPLFGGLVKFGSVCTPGANWATTLDLNNRVMVQGARLAAGKYSIWSIPGEEEWVLIFSRKHRAFHTSYPEGDDALRVLARPTTGDHMETLAFYFPVVGPDSAILNLHWGTTIVPLTLRLEPPRD